MSRAVPEKHIINFFWPDISESFFQENVCLTTAFIFHLTIISLKILCFSMFSEYNTGQN